nr:MAG TPA: hypothetical protein [Caudoviricetes sp.]
MLLDLSCLVYKIHHINNIVNRFLKHRCFP